MTPREQSIIRSCLLEIENTGSHDAAVHTLRHLISKPFRKLPKPIRKVRTKPRKGPMRDPRYRRWLRQFTSCVIGDLEVGPRNVCDDTWAIPDPAHTQNNGLSSKGPDSSCVPLCRKHHQEYDAGRAAFEKKYGVNMKALAAEHFERFQKEKEGK